MGRPKTIIFEEEKFNLSDHNKSTLGIFKKYGYIFYVSEQGALYGVKNKKFRLLDQVVPKPEHREWFFEKFE